MAEENTDRAFWEEFLDTFKQCPCLWNTKSASYSDKNVKRNAYEELVQLCKRRYPEANKDFVIKKIHNFRCGYRRELNKVRKSKRTGSGTDDLYVSNLWYFKILRFLYDDETPRSGIATWDEDNSQVGTTKLVTTYFLLFHLF